MATTTKISINPERQEGEWNPLTEPIDFSLVATPSTTYCAFFAYDYKYPDSPPTSMIYTMMTENTNRKNQSDSNSHREYVRFEDITMNVCDNLDLINYKSDVRCDAIL